MEITPSRTQAISIVLSYTYNDLNNRIKKSACLTLENINKVFSKSSSNRINSLEIATFHVLLIATHLITSPLLLVHQIFIATLNPKELAPFEKAKQLIGEDLIARRFFIIFYNHVSECIKPYQAHTLRQLAKQGGMHNRFKAICFTVIKVLAEPVAGITYTTSLCSLSAFHLIGALFSRKCTAEKGLYVCISNQPLAKALAKLLFIPINMVNELHEIKPFNIIQNRETFK